MSLKNIQKAQLEKSLIEEGVRRGQPINPFDLQTLLNGLYGEGDNRGLPLSKPYFQENRTNLDVESYNRYHSQVEFDLDVLLRHAKETRLKSRDTNVFNDIELVRLSSLLDNTEAELGSYLKKGEATSSKSESPNSFYQVSSNTSTYSSSQGIPRLEVNGIQETLTLPTKPNTVYKNMGFVRSLQETVQTVAAEGEVVRRKEVNTLENIIVEDSLFWGYELEVSGQTSKQEIEVLLPLDEFFKSNFISISPVPGLPLEVTLLASSGNGSWKTVGEGPLDKKQDFHFDVFNVRELRIILRSDPISSEDTTTSTYLYGINSLVIALKEYESTGEINISDIQGVESRPVVSAKLKVDADTPVGTDVSYFLGLGTDSQVRVEGSEESESVKFQVAQEFTSRVTDLMPSPSVSTTVNSITFTSYTLPALEDIIPADKSTLVERKSEVYLHQNALTETPKVEFNYVTLSDAKVEFKGDEVEGRIIAYREEAGKSVEGSGELRFISLDLPVANSSFYVPSSASEDFKSKSFSGDYGVLAVLVYSSLNPGNPRVVNVTHISDDLTKVYITGAFNPTDLFSVFCRSELNEQFVPEKGSFVVHTGYGKDGQEESNRIKSSDGLYRIDYVNNKILKASTTLPTSDLYVDLVGLQKYSTLVAYEGYLEVAEDVSSVILTEKMFADEEAGEYIGLLEKNTNEFLDLSNKAEIKDLRRGTYSVSILSKAYNPEVPSAIRSFVTAKNDPGNTVDLSDWVFRLDSDLGIVSRIGVYDKASIQVPKEMLYNKSRTKEVRTYSWVVADDQYQLVVPETNQKIFRFAGKVQASVDLTYFASNIFSGANVHSKPAIKIRMNNDANSATSFSTPVVKDMQLELEYA